MTEKEKDEFEALKKQVAETQELLAAKDEQISLLNAEKAGAAVGKNGVGVQVDGKPYLVVNVGTLPAGNPLFKGEYEGKVYEKREEIASDLKLVKLLIETGSGLVIPAPAQN